MTSWNRSSLNSVWIALALASCAPVMGQSSPPATAPAESRPCEPEPASKPQPAPWSERKPFDLCTASNFTGDWCGVRTELEKIGFTFELFHMEHYQWSYRGGKTTAGAHDYSGSYDLHPIIDLEKMKLVPGGLLFLEAQGAWGTGINPYVGALFDPNADIRGACYPIYLNKWWYRQFLADKKIELRVGVLETKKDDMFDISPYAFHEDRDFWNFEVLRDTTVPHRIGAGVFLKLKPVDWFYFQSAAIDAKNPPRTAEIHTAFENDPRYIGYWETGLTPKWNFGKGPMPGKYYIGWWYDGRDQTVFRGKAPKGETYYPVNQTGEMGYYLGFNQMIWKELTNPKDTQGLAFFSRYGADDRDVYKIQNYWELGLSCTGLVPTRDKDVTAFAFAQSILSKKYRQLLDRNADAETVFEWYYRIEVTPWCHITPDLQFIKQPGGDTTDRDAVIGGVRVRIIF